MRSVGNRPALYAATLALVLMFLISANRASAQNATGSQPDSKEIGNPGSAVDDATLKQTAKAYVKVKGIVETGEHAIDGTTDNTEKEHIAEQVESRKLAAVKSEGLQPQQYNHVLQLVQADKNLQKKFLTYAEQVKSGAE